MLDGDRVGMLFTNPRVIRDPIGDVPSAELHSSLEIFFESEAGTKLKEFLESNSTNPDFKNALEKINRVNESFKQEIEELQKEQNYSNEQIEELKKTWHDEVVERYESDTSGNFNKVMAYLGFEDKLEFYDNYGLPLYEYETALLTPEQLKEINEQRAQVEERSNALSEASTAMKEYYLQFYIPFGLQDGAEERQKLLKFFKENPDNPDLKNLKEKVDALTAAVDRATDRAEKLGCSEEDIASYVARGVANAKREYRREHDDVILNKVRAAREAMKEQYRENASQHPFAAIAAEQNQAAKQGPQSSSKLDHESEQEAAPSSLEVNSLNSKNQLSSLSTASMESGRENEVISAKAFIKEKLERYEKKQGQYASKTSTDENKITKYSQKAAKYGEKADSVATLKEQLKGREDEKFTRGDLNEMLHKIQDQAKGFSR